MTALLTLTDVSMHFSREADSRYAVFGGVNLTVGAGECVALIGRNGSGKSTHAGDGENFAPTSGSRLGAGCGGVAADPRPWLQAGLIGRDNAYLSCY